MKKKKRKICFVITSKIHYSRSKLILEQIRRHKNLELQIVLGGSALLDQYGYVEPLLTADGYRVDAKILMALGGGSTTAMAKTAGLALLEFASVLEQLDPDIVLIRGDRYELLSIAAAAAYMNKTIAHIEGGDLTGTIDESVRHAITKLAHIHFATTEDARRRLVRMGEDKNYVFNVGAPELEFVARNSYKANENLVNYLGVGDTVDIDKPFLLVMQHPVTTEIEMSREQIDETLHAVHDLGIPAIWFWPNIDAGSDEISKGIRAFRENVKPTHIRFLKYLPAEQFIGLLKKTACLIGNSSAGMKECSFLGVPVVNIGTRQDGRYRGKNVVDAPHDREAIKKAVKKHLKYGPYKKDEYFYKKGTPTSKKITKVLATAPLYIQKRFQEK